MSLVLGMVSLRWRRGSGQHLDIEEVLSGAGSYQLHVLVADVMKSFDTVDRSILDCALGRLGLPLWFRKVYLTFHSQASCRIGRTTVFIVALYVPWCRRLESIHSF